MTWTEAQRAYARTWRAKNADRVKQYYRNYDRRHPGRRRRTALLSQYRLSSEEFDAMVAQQDGCCAICLQRKRLVVDHSHATGVVRGLLCHRCNGLLAALDDAEFFAAAQRYLAAR